jgi:hypothetical protein
MANDLDALLQRGAELEKAVNEAESNEELEDLSAQVQRWLGDVEDASMRTPPEGVGPNTFIQMRAAPLAQAAEESARLQSRIAERRRELGLGPPERPDAGRDEAGPGLVGRLCAWLGIGRGKHGGRS